MKKIAIQHTAGALADLITEIEDLLLSSDGPMSISQLIKRLSPAYQQSLGLVGLTALLKQSDFKVDVHKNTVYLPAGYVGSADRQAGMTMDLVAGIKSYLKRVKDYKDSIGNIYRNLECKLRDHFDPHNIENILKTSPEFEVEHPYVQWLPEKSVASTVALSLKSAISKVSGQLAEFCKTYYSSVPLKELDKLFRAQGLLLIDEDGTEWQGIVTGKEGRAKLEIGILEQQEGEKYASAGKFLQLQWYKMPSGKFEINAYIS